MNIRLLGVLFLTLFVCNCKFDKDIENVARYINTLQNAGYTTVFSLFNVSRNATKEELAKEHAKLIKACYISKTKKLPMPVGKNLKESEAKSLIVNGYKILTDENQRKAYNWILDEAHPRFMEAYKERIGRKNARVPIFMPSMLALFITLLVSLIVFDGLRIVMRKSSKQKETKGKKGSKKKSKQEKQQKESKVGIDLRDMYIYKGYSKCRDILSQVIQPKKSQKAE